MKAVEVSWGEKWDPVTHPHGWKYICDIVNGAGLSFGLRSTERLSIRFDNGQLCTFKRKASSTKDNE